MTSAYVALPPSMIGEADTVAKSRQASALRNGHGPKNNAADDLFKALAMHVTGCRGEVAGREYFAAYGLELPWHKNPNGVVAGSPDLGDFIDVKTRPKVWHEMIIQHGNDPAFAYLFVCTENNPVFEIVGWCWGWEGLQKRYLKDPTGHRYGGYFIPRGDPILKHPRELVSQVLAA